MKTQQALPLVGLSYNQFTYVLRAGLLKPPAKDVSGDFDWTPADIERARAVARSLRRRRTHASTTA